jgi:hypothetical protein
MLEVVMLFAPPQPANKLAIATVEAMPYPREGVLFWSETSGRTVTIFSHPVRTYQSEHPLPARSFSKSKVGGQLQTQPR